MLPITMLVVITPLERYAYYYKVAIVFVALTAADGIDFQKNSIGCAESIFSICLFCCC
jgi:hypothetical protein